MPLAEDILRALSEMKTHRAQHENQWDDDVKLFIPFRGDVTTKTVPGSTRIDSVLDSVGAESADQLVNFVFGSIFPDKWLNLYIRKPNGQIDTDKQQIADITTQRIMDALDESNFYSESIEFLRDMIVLGTGIMRMRDDMIFDAVHIPEAYIIENEKKRVDTVFWEFELTFRQAAERYGIENLPQHMREALVNGDISTSAKFIQAVFPRTDSIPWSKQAETNKPFASVILNLDGNEKIISQDGFNRNPYIVGRWMKVRGWIWGAGVADKVRPDMKGANEILRQILLAIPMSARPPLAVSHEGVMNTDILPGGLLIMRQGAIDPRFVQPGSDYAAAQEVRMDGHKVIRSAFLVDLLNEPETEPRSAAESIRRQRMALQKLAGPARRIYDEFLSPISRLIVSTMIENDMLPELVELIDRTERPPDVVIGFNSPLLTAQREASLSGLLQTVSETADLAQLDPRWMDAVNPDGTLEVIREARTLPAKAFFTSDEVAAARNARADAAARAEMAELAEKAAKASKALQQ